jgi:uncharacterized protein YndB with AHSA1/START domain
MSRAIHRHVTYPHPPERVWRALTDPAALAQWLMPNDFEPRVGHRFRFRTDPAPGFDGIVDCEVLRLEPPRLLEVSWRGGGIDTVVTWLLEPGGAGGTRLSLAQTGFEGPRGFLVSRILLGGFGRIYGSWLPHVLDRMAAGTWTPEDPPATEACEDGRWRRLRERLAAGR